MNSKERVLSAINHQTTDRVPLDFWAEAPVWTDLLNSLGYSTRSELLERLHIDLRWIDHNYIGPEVFLPQNDIFENMWGERFRPTDDGMFSACGGALDQAQSFSEIEQHHWPSNDWVTHDHLEKSIYQNEGYAVLYGYADIWQRAAMVRGLDNMFLDMIEHPEWVHFMTGKLTEFYKNDWLRAMEAAGGHIDIFFLISDLGTQRGPMISLDLFREFIKPRIKEMADLVHDFGKKLLFHSCGSVRSYIDDLIEAGVDILNPIQPKCTGMSPEELKEIYGSKLCFHGGVDVQELLPYASTQEVRHAIRQMIEIMQPDGGFILCPSHTLMPDIAIDNIIAMYDEAHQVSCTNSI